MALTPKQQRFVAEYLGELNATQAAIRAGYSAKTADREGYRLLRKAEIAAAVQAGKSKQIAAADLSAARVLEELRRLAFADLRRLFDEHGNLKPLTQLSAEDAAAIASIEVVKKNLTAGDGKVDTVVKIRAWDKTRGLEMLAKHFALLTDVVRVDESDALIAKLHAGRKRAAAARQA